jgi:hypothetical protein
VTFSVDPEVGAVLPRKSKPMGRRRCLPSAQTPPEGVEIADYHAPAADGTRS